MLIGVYALHLVFLQALMQAAPSHDIDKNFKPLFAKHQNNGNKPQQTNHPAVSYYTMLIKQGKEARGISSVEAPVIGKADITLPVSPSAIAVTFGLYKAGLARFNIADDAFKRYRLYQVFLI
jgi:hypothetical protein